MKSISNLKSIVKRFFAKALRTLPGLKSAEDKRGQEDTKNHEKNRKGGFHAKPQSTLPGLENAEDEKGKLDGYVIDRLRKDPINIFTMCYALAN